jgi:tetratricopeptide (TPR) repeat protein
VSASIAAEAERRSTETNDRLELATIAGTFTNVALSYVRAGYAAQALPLLKRSLAISSKLSGKDSIDLANAYNNLAYVQMQLLEFPDALESSERAKAIVKPYKLESPRLWGVVLGTTGDVHRAVGRYDEAEEELIEAFHLYEQFNEARTYEIWHELGKLYRDKGDFVKAKSYFEMDLPAREKQYGVDHPEVATSLVEYAKLLELAGNDEHAQQAKLRADSIRNKLVPLQNT